MLRRAIPEVAAVSGQAAVPLVLANSDTLQLNPAAAVTVDARREAYRRGALLALERLAATHPADADFAAGGRSPPPPTATLPPHGAGPTPAHPTHAT